MIDERMCSVLNEMISAMRQISAALPDDSEQSVQASLDKAKKGVDAMAKEFREFNACGG